MRQFILVIATLFLFSSCGQNVPNEKDLELKERELVIKQKELELKEKENNLKGNDIVSNVNQSFADVKVSAFLIYRTGKLSSFDVLNDKSISLFNTIIGEGSSEDWSDKTKIIISGMAKDISLVIKNGNKTSVNKKHFDINNKVEFIISDTGCEEVVIKISTNTKIIFTGSIPFGCGE